VSSGTWNYNGSRLKLGFLDVKHDSESTSERKKEIQDFGENQKKVKIEAIFRKNWRSFGKKREFREKKCNLPKILFECQRR
jgi:hypothetical protein